MDTLIETLCHDTTCQLSGLWLERSPVFPRCFLDTIFYLLPLTCFIVSVFFFTVCHYFTRSIITPVASFGTTNRFQLSSVSSLLLVQVIELVLIQLPHGEVIVTAHRVSSLVKVLSSILVVINIRWNASLSISTCASGWLYSLWLSLVNCLYCLILAMGHGHLNRGGVCLLIAETLASIASLVSLSFSSRPSSIHPHLRVDEHPSLHSSFLSLFTFHWVQELAIKGWKKHPLKVTDLYPIHPIHSSSFIENRMNRIWHSTTGEKGIFTSLVKCFSSFYLQGALVGLIYEACILIQPRILKWTLIFMTAGDDAPSWHGYLLVLATFSLGCLASATTCWSLDRFMRSGAMCRTAVNVLLYRKVLSVSLSRGTSTTGEILNLMSVDADRFADMVRDFDVILLGFTRIIFSSYFIYLELGVSAFAGLSLLLILMPVTFYASKLTERTQESQMKRKDERIKMINEILTGIKVIKFYAWESSFIKLICAIRDMEISKLRIIAYLNACFSFVFTSATVLVSLVSFFTYIYIDSSNILTPEKAFVSLAYFALLNEHLFVLPQGIVNFVLARVSCTRLNKFLNLPDLESYITCKEDGDFIIRVKNAHISHLSDESGTFTLSNINMNIREGSLVAIVGRIASGKSSLLASLLGEMSLTAGCINVRRKACNSEPSIAYVSQRPWIQNDSLKSNILFGKTEDGHRYNSVLQTCELTVDLEALPAGDRTEIGEKGVNLSGGQKQRVSLARAVYSDAHIYLLDDPLSSVDAQVSSALFNNVISSRGLLAGKTRILVTNDLSLLPQVDEIFVLEDGSITESGSYDDLVNRQGNFCTFLQQFSPSEPSTVDSNVRNVTDVPDDDDENSNSSVDESDADDHRLIAEERMQVGRVAYHTILSYLKSMPYLSCAVILLILMQVTESLTNYWLTRWTDDTSTRQLPKESNLIIYACLALASCILALLGALLLYRGGYSSSATLHRSLLDGILRCPIEFFDTTPVGRIINRFSKDIDTLDNILPPTLLSWLTHFIRVAATFVIIIAVTPYFLILIVPLVVIYYVILIIYIPACRQIQRLTSINLSPVYSHFSETLSGTSTIRAFRVSSRFACEFEEKLDTSQRVSYSSIAICRWMAYRLRMIGTMITTSTTVFCIAARDTISPGYAGLAITYAMSMTELLDWLIEFTSILETDVVAVERIFEYKNAQPEAEWRLQSAPDLTGWPRAGEIEFINYSTRYRANLAPALINISFKVTAGEKVAVVGRTGAGKSSLTLSLFRLLEPISGSIIIDGIDITTIGLHDLRESLTIIPQDAILFSGKLRNNLDPFNRYTDEELWQALETSHLKQFVLTLDGALDYEVAEGGENLSVGQRQLICFARAILKKSRILVLDEATAAVDMQTDSQIQEILNTTYTDCTLLTIAHRLQTIISYDRILVLHEGQVVQFDTPSALLADETGIFYSLAKEAKIV